MRDRLAFVVVFVSPEGGLAAPGTEREARRSAERDGQGKGWTMMRTLTLEFFLSLARGSHLRSLSTDVSLPPRRPFARPPTPPATHRRRHRRSMFPCFTWKKQVSANKGLPCQIALAWISGRSRDYNGRDNAYYAPQHRQPLCRSNPHGNGFSRGTAQYAPANRLPQGLTGYHDFPLADPFFRAFPADCYHFYFTLMAHSSFNRLRAVDRPEGVVRPHR